jgi:hypothetical protein
VEYSLHSQLFEEPRVGERTREIDRERKRWREAPKGLSFSSTLIVCAPPPHVSNIYRRKGGMESHALAIWDLKMGQ